MERNVIKMISAVADQTMALAKENSVWGDPIERDGVIVIPISKLTVGFAAGGADTEDGSRKKSRHPAGGGAKVTRTPISFLVISGGEVHMMQAEAPAASSPAWIDTLLDAAKEMIRKKEEK